MTPARSPHLVILLLVALGAAIVLANREQPLVRNSLVYARASEHVLAHDYDPRPVVADSKLSYDKPILYAWLSAPFVAALGNHDGLRVTSFLGTVAYLLAVLYFARSSRTSGESLLVWLAALGPCVVYQFWSAHPDSWFAALVVTAWALAERIVARPESNGARRVVLLGVTIYLAILLKNYGLVLFLGCPMYVLWHARRVFREHADRKRLAFTGLAVFGIIGVLVLLAWSGHHPLSRLEGEGGGVGQYGTGELWRSAKGAWIQVGIALLLQFQVALVFALRPAAWRREDLAPLVCFGLVYVAGLMPFPTTFYNMRYFLPLFPLVARVLARGATASALPIRRGVLVAHGTLGVALIAVFNLAPIHRLAEPAIPKLEVDWIGPRLSLLDNLRMKLHRDQRSLLDHIDHEVPAGATLYMMDVGYYGDAQHGVYERAGLIRPDIATRYVSRRDFHPSEPMFYVWSASSRRPELGALDHVTDLGRSLYRVEVGG